MSPAAGQGAAGRPATARRTAREETLSASWASSPAVRGRMQLQRTRDTAPELAIRRRLHARGLRYRVDATPIRGFRRRADIVFGPSRVAVFVDGCFWHGCPRHGSRATRANPDYWSAKVARNRQRDEDTDAQLASAGWLSIRIWEHDDPDATAERIAAAVASRRPRSEARPAR